MNKVIISPYSQKLRNGKNNPKNYFYWQELIELMRDYEIYQIGRSNEPLLQKTIDKRGMTLKGLKDFMFDIKYWISVDNFFPHFCNHVFGNSKLGIVLFSKSDPELFGYSYNINILKNKKYLRKNQFDIWENEEYEQEAFRNPGEIIKIIKRYFI